MYPDLQSRIYVVMSDIIELNVDAVVNAANESLLGGSGVDGAIHKAAGPELLEACKKLGGCSIGKARITPGFNMRARYIIHTVGPVWTGGWKGEPELLESCYRSALDLARDNGCKSVAFPAISTGAYGFPPAPAAALATRAVADYLLANDMPEKVVFCCFSPESAGLHRQALTGYVFPIEY